MPSLAAAYKMEPMRDNEEEELVQAITRVAKSLASEDRVRALLRVLKAKDGLTSHDVWPEHMSLQLRHPHLKMIRPYIDVLPGVGRSPSIYTRGEISDEVEQLLELMFIIDSQSKG